MFRYVEGLKIPPSGSMTLSKVWHETVENNYRQKIKSERDLPLSDMQDFYSTRFDETLQNEEIQLEENENPGKLKDEGINVTTLHHQVIAPKVKPVLVEEKFRVSLGDEFLYDLVGIWDVVETDNVIADNKCYGKTPSQESTDRNLQLTLYALGFRVLNNKVEQGIRLDVIVRTKQLKAIQIETHRTNDDCQFLLKLIEGVATAIQTGNYYPNPTHNLCSPKWCGYWDKCKKMAGRGKAC